MSSGVLAANYDKRAEGDRWLCPRCGSPIARVTEIHGSSLERLQYDAAIEAYMKVFQEQGDTDLTKELKKLIPARPSSAVTMTLLTLPQGYVFSKVEGIWKKPKNPRGWSNGADQRHLRQFRNNKIARAERVGDLATVIHERGILKANQKSKSLPDNEPGLFAKDLPITVLCQKPGCFQKILISSVQGF